MGEGKIDNYMGAKGLLNRLEAAKIWSRIIDRINWKQIGAAKHNKII